MEHLWHELGFSPCVEWDGPGQLRYLLTYPPLGSLLLYLF